MSALALVTSLSACGTKAGDEPAVVESVEEIAPGSRNARRALRSSFPGLYAEYLADRVQSEPLRFLLTTDEPPIGLKRMAMLAELYRDTGWEPIFVRDGELTHRAQAFFHYVPDLEHHGLGPDKYLRPAIREAAQRQDELRSALERIPMPGLRPAELDALSSLIEDPALRERDDMVSEILRRIFSAPTASTSPLPEHWRIHRQRLVAARAAAGGDAMLEARIADAFLDFGYDMRNGNWIHANPEADEEEQLRIIGEQMRASWESFSSSADYDAAQAALRAHEPHHDQYAKLVTERRRYAQIVASGGWPEVPAQAMSRGSRGNAVRTLAERLAAEGLYAGEVGNTFTRELEDAVKLYQRTHQMEETGSSSRGFWSSINTPAEDRLAQIDLTLQRWRESRIGDADYYFLVNIPDFHAEVWRNGVREMRYRIVVGNRQQECIGGRKQYVNATPIQSAVMSYVVVNPYWNVPPRIMREELLPALLEDPTYFETHGYEYETRSDGGTFVRQLPGENNALGAVKFIFPNPHGTYMHDTPRRGFFDYPIRAFSHGCMRVQDPMGLLEYVLTNDGQWDAANIERIQEHGREHRINLRTPIPVHIEYYVVRIDDEGHANFLSDVYRYDRMRLDPSAVADLDCSGTRSRPNLALSADGRVLTRDAAGNLVDARVATQQEAAPDALDNDDDSLPALVPAGGGDMGP